jgi:hypothetical protein
MFVPNLPIRSKKGKPDSENSVIPSTTTTTTTTTPVTNPTTSPHPFHRSPTPLALSNSNEIQAYHSFLSINSKIPTTPIKQERKSSSVTLQSLPVVKSIPKPTTNFSSNPAQSSLNVVIPSLFNENENRSETTSSKNSTSSLLSPSLSSSLSLSTTTTTAATTTTTTTTTTTMTKEKLQHDDELPIRIIMHKSRSGIPTKAAEERMVRMCPQRSLL